MTLYFENPLNFHEPNAISINEVWHPTTALLAVGSFSQNHGGYVTIFDEMGEPLKDINFPVHHSYQATALAWHPEIILLISGWENGELKVWHQEKEFKGISGPHKGPITLLEFSKKGERLVSCDSTGSVVGWKVDSKGFAATVFHLELKESITHLTFRLSVKMPHDYDIDSLAKAAVNGDENALDIFSNWRPKTTARKFRVSNSSDNLCFFVATQIGSIFYVNASGSCSEVLNTEGTPLSYIVYHPSRDVMVVMMEGLTIGHFSVDSSGHLTEMAKVKLSGTVQTRIVGNQGLVWAGDSCLAILAGDLTVRVWDIDTNDNYILPTSLKLYNNDQKKLNVNEVFTCLSYCKLNQTLCAGTNVGRIYFWVKTQNKAEDNPENFWELKNVNTISGTVKQLTWGSVQLRIPIISVNCVTAVYIMKEQNTCYSFSKNVWATQKTPNQILVQNIKSDYLLQADIQVTNMYINDEYIALTNGRIITVYGITFNDNQYNDNNSKQDFRVKLLKTFTCENEDLALYKDYIITLNSRGICMKKYNSSAAINTSVSSNEGEPIGMNLNKAFLTVFTVEGFMKIFNLNDNDLKPMLTVNIADIALDFGEIIQAKTNCEGTKVALTVASANLIPDGKLYIYDIDNDAIITYDFHMYAHTDNSLNDDFIPIQGDNASEKDLQFSKEDKIDKDDFVNINNSICMGRMPLNVHWDQNDARLLVCDAKKVKVRNDVSQDKYLRRSQSDVIKNLKDEEHIIVTMFASVEHGIKIHDIKPINVDTKLLAIATPYVVILNKLSIERMLMSDFVGLENCNDNTRDAVLDFSYNLSLGNMDAAFKAIKLKSIESASVWNSLARMCVKTRRLDVAGVCLGHMKNAKAARALRLAIADEKLEQEAKLAVLAIELGMLDEAEQLYTQCERFDLLNKLLQRRNKMDAAHAIAESKDRIHLRNTEHEWAKVLEQNGEITEAMARYERAQTHRYDVPRMLVDQPQLLQNYMEKTKDPELLKWWGQYIESQGDMVAALKIYSAANDTYSQVRVLCFLGQEAKAAELSRSDNNKAAFYHMARHYETTGKLDSAVNFFTKASAYSNAIRLCKENQMENELWDISLIASSREKLEAAVYFEENGFVEKAITLYHRAGMLHKSLDLAFKSQQYEILQEIATDLNNQSDPALLEKCAQYFVSNDQFDKAVDLLATAKKFEEAIDICVQHNVQLDENLVEKLTPDKDELDEELRVTILEKLAESLMVQGNYHLATKKFTQSGDKNRAMKALLKSGDTEKIIFFATVSRQKEIYIMAANYLQSLDWQNNPEVLKNIITFYSKGKALDLLANFYVACAQVEIDEFQNYEKALGALTEASRCLSKVAVPNDAMQHKNMIDVVDQRLALIKKFVDIRKLIERGEIQAGLAQCQHLLTTSNDELEESVRRGDIYALMIHTHVENEHFAEAKQLFLELRHFLSATSNIPITYYVNKELLEALARGLGVSVSLLIPTVPTVANTLTDDLNNIEEVLEETE